MKTNELPERVEAHSTVLLDERGHPFAMVNAADNYDEIASELARRWNAHKGLLDLLKEASDLYIDPKAAPPEFMRALRDALKNQEILTP